MPITMSPLRYPGGKTRFYDYIKNILECNNLIGQTYIEPFAGGAGLAIKLLLNNDVKRIVLNDLDPSIYSFWKSILTHTDDFCNLILDTEITPEEWIRQRDIYFQQDITNSLALGFATFFLNRTNVSGVIKGGLIGGINQNGSNPMNARFNKTNLIEKIHRISAYKDQIVLLNMDGLELLKPNNLRQFYKAFINFDPPYVKKGAKLYKNSFNENDHRNLSEEISRCGRKWIVTYDICPLVKDLYSNFRYSYLDVRYSINKNKKAQEYIFFSDNLVIPENIDVILPS
ncbi:DNA adenine methylase [Bacillus atrophaeus]|uniref:DNA adenine methylase n=1 Tax=Bacillus atrophaeus TaxID=1452 RepID=UPI00227F873F|nr:DNA adenine methylase [Bacillus atrophaeus]MCY8836510.1 DNA adenine methylase [Bacillus atrophaeus]MED4719718.1 DNA adenine methylase [Bacillus atrophaeus]